MKLGYIHTNREEQGKVAQVLRTLAEPTALDELGIGRIRDAFADLMFPGVSTLQRRVKYFSLMPQLFKRACQRQYNRPSEVKGEVIRLEKLLTERLYEGSPADNRTGITGIDWVVGGKKGSFVKYDPVYIYTSGLQTFEILRSSQIYDLIYAASKQLHAAPKRMTTDDEDTANDATDSRGLFQFCAFPEVEYDFTEQCSIVPTEADCAFITDHILKANSCRGSLWRYIVEHDDLPLAENFPGIDPRLLPDNLAAIQRAAAQFAYFIYMVHLRYNCIFANYTDDDMQREFEEAVDEYRASGMDIDRVLEAVTIRENSGKVFCHQVAECISADDMAGLDNLIIKRERRIKGSRHKLQNPAHDYASEGPIHKYKLTFRWPTVKAFAEELRKGGKNG